MVTVEEIAQAARRWRPLPRRAAMIARPARVRIRRRKPCFLCRRRLFGWNVRLLTGMTPVTREHKMSTNPLIGSVQGACPAHRRRTREQVPQGAQHETAGSTPTDPRYVAPCGQVKPGIPRLFHRLVDRIVGNRSGQCSSLSDRNDDRERFRTTTTLRRPPDTPQVAPNLLFIACG